MTISSRRHDVTRHDNEQWVTDIHSVLHSVSGPHCTKIADLALDSMLYNYNCSNCQKNKRGSFLEGLQYQICLLRHILYTRENSFWEMIVKTRGLSRVFLEQAFSDRTSRNESLESNISSTQGNPCIYLVSNSL